MENEATSVGKVLVAENDRDLCRALGRRLQLWGWQVTAAEDGPSAVDAACAETFDVLLLDLRLPKWDGLAVLATLRERAVQTPVVMFSGFLDEETTRAAIRLGAREVLEKPVEPETLQRVLADFARADHVTQPMARRAPEPVPELVGDSLVAQQLRAEVRKVAPFVDLPVMVVGETGAGKEVLANAIHRLSRVGGPCLAINCAAMPETLFESELFGHAQGAFTGAKSAHTGLLESAADGTIFLDEVGELPPGTQAKLLRVLETRRFRPVGASRELPLRARVVSATNRALRGRAGEALRSDLYFRLAGYRLMAPPLRDRMDDLPPLVAHFLRQFAEHHPSARQGISPQAVYALSTHIWPGNVRELRAVLFAAMVNANGQRIEVRHVLRELESRRASLRPHAPESGVQVLPPVETEVTRSHPKPPDSGVQTLPSMERELMERTYQACDGNLSRAARQLDIPRTTLRNKLKRYNLF